MRGWIRSTLDDHVLLHLLFTLLFFAGFFYLAALVVPGIRWEAGLAAGLVVFVVRRLAL